MLFLFKRINSSSLLHPLHVPDRMWQQGALTHRRLKHSESKKGYIFCPWLQLLFNTANVWKRFPVEDPLIESSFSRVYFPCPLYVHVGCTCKSVMVELPSISFRSPFFSSKHESLSVCRLFSLCLHNRVPNGYNSLSLSFANDDADTERKSRNLFPPVCASVYFVREQKKIQSLYVLLNFLNKKSRSTLSFRPFYLFPDIISPFLLSTRSYSVLLPLHIHP